MKSLKERRGSTLNHTGLGKMVFSVIVALASSVMCTQATASLKFAKKSGAHKLPIASDVIVDSQPQGLLHKNLVREGLSLYEGYGGIKVYDYDYGTGTYVEGDDGKVYVKDPFNRFPTNTYLVLEKGVGDTLIARLPQAIYDYEGVNLYAIRYRLNGDGYELDLNDDGSPVGEVKFVLKDGVLTQLGTSVDASGFPSMIIGLGDETGEWAGYGDGKTVVKPLDEWVAQLPQGVEPQEYRMDYQNSEGDIMSQVVKVAISGKDLYLSDPVTRSCEQWIKGTLEQGKVTFKKQYLGIDSTEYCHLFLSPCAMASGSQAAPDYIEQEQLEFNYFETDRRLESATPQQVMLFSCSKKDINAVSAYLQPQFKPFTVVPATPANPVIRKVKLYGGEYIVSYYIPTQDDNGDFIDPDRLGYNIYLNHRDFPETFHLQNQFKETVVLTDIPYFFTDDWYFLFENGNHTFTQTIPVFWALGIRSIYTVDGDTRYSDIVWYETETAVPEINADESLKVKGVHYYDLLGRKLHDMSVKGLCVKETVYDNGQKKTEKVVR